MTTFSKRKQKCAVCGVENEYNIIRSTNAFGAPDLDTRPPQMKRATIFAWAQRCPECGYCASDITKASDQAAAIVASQEYHEQLSNCAFPDLANSFLCKAIIEAKSSSYAAAAWSLIHAAWVCDDMHLPEAARQCRNKAVEMLLKAREAGQRLAQKEGADIAILVDLLRRAGRGTEARQVLATERAEIKDEIILRVLAFQEVLIAHGDAACHTVAEALEVRE